MGDDLHCPIAADVDIVLERMEQGARQCLAR